MQTRHVGRSGLVVSRLGLGTMTWGRDTDADDAAAQLTSFRDAGGTLVDTAAGYSDGDAERLLGTLLGPVVTRDDIVIATKAGIGRRTGERTVDTSRRALLDGLDGSLARLGVDHIDLWQVHAWSDATPLEETMSALDVAVATGRTRYVGISNYRGWQTARAATWQAAWPGRAPLISTQVEYSLLARGVEDEVVPAADHTGLGLLAWSPLGRGVLTGKYRGGVPGDSRAACDAYAEFVGRYLTEEANRVVGAVVTAADGLGVSPVAVALAWVRDRPQVCCALVGARSNAQLAASLASEAVVLPQEIRAALDDVSAQ